MNKKTKQNIINIAIIIIYAVITFMIMLKHEPWRDEAQAWLISKNLNFFDIIAQMRYEGHPALWHMLLMPFAKLNLPPITLNIISWILMVITAALILYKAPFKKITKIFILCSAPFMYFYIAISRVYTLIAFLVVIIACIYKEKDKHPVSYGILLALLANTHIIMLGLVSLLIFDGYIKNIYLKIKNKNKVNKNEIIGFIISFLGILLLIFQLYSSLNMNKSVHPARNISTILNNARLYGYTISEILFGKSNLIYVIMSIILVFALPFIIVKDNMRRFIYYGTILYQFVIYIVIYKFTGQAMYNIYFLILLMLWIEYDKIPYEKVIDVLLIVITIIGSMHTINIIRLDNDYNYSSSKEMGEYICKNINENDTIISLVDYTTTPVTMYCHNYNFYSLQQNKSITFATWSGERDISTNDIRDIVEKSDKENKYLLYVNTLLANKIIENFAKLYKLEPVYITDGSMVQDEAYILYKIEDKEET